MKFVRLYGSGLDKNRRDVRDKIWAEFHCSLCGKNHDIDVTNTMNTFQFDRERKCPSCGNIDINDKENNLKLSIEKLTQEKSRIEIQIQQLINELNNINSFS